MTTTDNIKHFQVVLVSATEKSQGFGLFATREAALKWLKAAKLDTDKSFKVVSSLTARLILI